jgi:hypothetical protein
VVDALDITRCGGDRFMAGDVLRQIPDYAEEPVIALNMPFLVMLFENRAGDGGIVHQVTPKEAV